MVGNTNMEFIQKHHKFRMCFLFIVTYRSLQHHKTSSQLRKHVLAWCDWYKAQRVNKIWLPGAICNSNPSCKWTKCIYFHCSTQAYTKNCAFGCFHSNKCGHAQSVKVCWLYSDFFNRNGETTTEKMLTECQTHKWDGKPTCREDIRPPKWPSSI